MEFVIFSSFLLYRSVRKDVPLTRNLSSRNAIISSRLFLVHHCILFQSKIVYTKLRHSIRVADVQKFPNVIHQSIPSRSSKNYTSREILLFRERVACKHYCNFKLLPLLSLCVPGQSFANLISIVRNFITNTKKKRKKEEKKPLNFGAR